MGGVLMTRFLFWMALWATLSAPWAGAASLACGPMHDAMLKLYSIPVHVYSTENAAYAGGKVRSSEIIYLNHATFVEVNGKWQTSKITQETMREIREKEALKDSNATCRVVREDTVNGETAVLYSVHQSVEETKIDSQVWISKAQGLPLKIELDMDVGGKLGKSHRSMRYEYTNVQAPAGVR
jgi:hypothetical protein